MAISTLPSPEASSRDEYIQAMLAGGYPEMRVLEERRRQRRYRDYVDTIVERDVADLLKIRKSDALRRLIDQLAVRTGNELNVQGLAGTIGVQRPTVETYLDVLTKLSLLWRLPAWTLGRLAETSGNRSCISWIREIVAASRIHDASHLPSGCQPNGTRRDPRNLRPR